jgi:hypothetical protein
MKNIMIFCCEIQRFCIMCKFIMRFFFLMIFVAGLLWVALPSIADPKEDACESIVIGEYIGTETSEGLEHQSTQFNSLSTTVAYFQVIEILKGPPLNKRIPIRYDLEGGDKRSAISQKVLLPKVGSKWILFIPTAAPWGPSRVFDTFNGSQGREELSNQRLVEVRKAIATPPPAAKNWEQWHEGIETYLRHSFELSNGLFSHGPSLSAKVVWTVSKDGRILNAQLTKMSSNERFNTLVLHLVNSMAGQPFLRFPEQAKNNETELYFIFSNHLWYETVN